MMDVRVMDGSGVEVIRARQRLCMSVTILIVATDDVLGGKPRVEGTRVAVDQVGALLRVEGWSRETILSEFGLTAAELDAAVAYYDANDAEMQRLRDRRQDLATDLQAQSRAPSPRSSWRPLVSPRSACSRPRHQARCSQRPRPPRSRSACVSRSTAVDLRRPPGRPRVSSRPQARPRLHRRRAASPSRSPRASWSSASPGCRRWALARPSLARRPRPFGPR